eukprot:945303-Amphidinium_carterae.1
MKTRPSTESYAIKGPKQTPKCEVGHLRQVLSGGAFFLQDGAAFLLEPRSSSAQIVALYRAVASTSLCPVLSRSREEWLQGKKDSMPATVG